MTTIADTLAAVQAAATALNTAITDFQAERDSATLDQVQQLTLASAGAVSAAQTLNDEASTRMIELDFNAQQGAADV